MSMQNIGKHHKSTSGKNRKYELIQPDDYSDGRTKQCYKDECNIQKIMMRAQKAGTISHLEKYQGVYADYSDFDFREQTQRLAEGRQLFDELPAEIRREFGQSPQKFFDYVNDPANADNLHELLPGLAAPGTQMQKVVPALADEEPLDPTPSAPAVDEPQTPEVHS